MNAAPETFLELLARRDEYRAMIHDERVDRIVVGDLKNRMVFSLRQAIDELGKIDVQRKPMLSARIDAEMAWIRELITVFFAEPDA